MAIQSISKLQIPQGTTGVGTASTFATGDTNTGVNLFGTDVVGFTTEGESTFTLGLSG